MALFRPQARYGRLWSGDLLVFSPGPIPTVDFYVASRIRPDAGIRVRYIRGAGDLPADEPLPGAFAVVVRHAEAACLRWLAARRERWSGVAYLMDDDIPAAWRSRDVPLDYGIWTSARYALAAPLLAAVCDRIWVSTPELARRYAARSPQVVAPLAERAGYAAAPAACRRWGYHGTRVHKNELRWLLPVVERVQAAVADAEFEVFGEAGLAARFARIPRVSVVPPRPWPEYVAHCRRHPLAVGVAPLLPGRFNDARSHVKVFDLARSGAAGIFSARAPYAPQLAHAGVALLANDGAAWADEVCRLLADPALRSERYAHMLAWIEAQGRGDDLAGLIAGRRAPGSGGACARL